MRILSAFFLLKDTKMRIVSLILSLLLAGCIFFNSPWFFGHDGKIPFWLAILIIWSVCSGVIFGVGFQPNRQIWKIIFSPYIAIVIMGCTLVYFFCN